MGVILSHAVAASLYYFRSSNRPEERNVRDPLLVENKNKHDPADSGFDAPHRDWSECLQDGDTHASFTVSTFFCLFSCGLFYIHLSLHAVAARIYHLFRHELTTTTSAITTTNNTTATTTS